MYNFSNATAFPRNPIQQKNIPFYQHFQFDMFQMLYYASIDQFIDPV